MTSASHLLRNPLRWPAVLLGLALGGFFDGILLHQILQWHHLLSNVDAVRDLRMQVLADGVFHALMYVVAAVALVQLWHRRPALGQPGAGRTLWGHALIGFGGWHVLDAVLSHWLTGIHRIKVDSPQPLLWDLAWFVVFGLVPAALGWWGLRRPTGPGNGPGADVDRRDARAGRGAAGVLGLSALLAGPIAALPAGDADQVTVLFAPGISPAEAFNALARLDARVLWVDKAGGMWAVSLPEDAPAWSLYREGALLVSRSAVALGCLSWIRAGGAGPSGPLERPRA